MQCAARTIETNRAVFMGNTLIVSHGAAVQVSLQRKFSRGVSQ